MTTAGGVRPWLAAREAGVPPALRDRIRELLDAAERERADLAAAAPPEPVAATLARAAAGALRLAAAGGCARRADALDVLAADALVTYACEAIAGAPDLDAAAAALVRQLTAAPTVERADRAP